MRNLKDAYTKLCIVCVCVYAVIYIHVNQSPHSDRCDQLCAYLFIVTSMNFIKRKKWRRALLCKMRHERDGQPGAGYWRHRWRHLPVCEDVSHWIVVEHRSHRWDDTRNTLLGNWICKQCLSVIEVGKLSWTEGIPSLQGQQFWLQSRNPDVLRYLFQLLGEDYRRLTTRCNASSISWILVPPFSWTCLKHLPGETARRHPDQRRLAPLDVEDYFLFNIPTPLSVAPFFGSWSALFVQTGAMSPSHCFFSPLSSTISADIGISSLGADTLSLFSCSNFHE